MADNLPCEICLSLHTLHPERIIFEAAHVAVIPEDTEFRWCGMCLCEAHYRIHLRVTLGQPLSGLSGGIQ